MYLFIYLLLYLFIYYFLEEGRKYIYYIYIIGRKKGRKEARKGIQGEMGQ